MWEESKLFPFNINEIMELFTLLLMPYFFILSFFLLTLMLFRRLNVNIFLPSRNVKAPKAFLNFFFPIHSAFIEMSNNERSDLHTKMYKIQLQIANHLHTMTQFT